MTRRELVVAFAAGLLFAVGLGVAGMTQPAKVIGFLDVFGGRWDPSRALVMAGALAVYLPAYQWLTRRRAVHEIGSCGPVGVETVDRRVLTGAAIFGVGWGLGGYCPGPAVVSAASGGAGVLLFLAAMVAGMGLAGRGRDRVRAPFASVGEYGHENEYVSEHEDVDGHEDGSRSTGHGHGVSGARAG